ncbi:MAG: nucleotidyltransferase family protein [Actinomycetota bacterium]
MADLDELPEAAAFHGVPGAVFRYLQEFDPGSSEVFGRLRATFHRALGMHLRAVADLHPLSSILDSLGVPWLVLKGPILAEHVYSKRGTRGYTDLDILVPPRCLAEVVDAFRESGIRLVEQDWNLLVQQGSAQLSLVAPMGTIIDLHWHPLNDPLMRSTLALPVEALFDRVQLVPVGGRPVPSLDPVDMVVYLALHACISGGNRLVWFKDVDQAALLLSSDWDALSDRCRSWRAELAVAIMLEGAIELLETPVPDGLVSQLAGNAAWTGLAGLTRKLAPVERATGRRSPVRLVSRATRSNFASSARQLVRSTVSGATRPLSAWPPELGRPGSKPNRGGSFADYVIHANRKPA